MKAAGVVLGSVAIAVCMSGCSLTVVEHDLSSGGPSLGQPAILEYKITPSTLSRVDLVEVDGHPVDEKRANVRGFGVRSVFKLAPGTHRVRFRGEEGSQVHPDVVEFEAGAGKRYRLEFERFNNKETDGQVTTLYFNFVSPVVLEERDGRPVKVAAGASAPFKTGFDAQKNVLLYEETTLPKERTARVNCWVGGRGVLIFIAGISGRAGETRVEYRRTWFDLSQYYHFLPGSWPEVWQLRLLPGEYRFGLTMTGQLEEAQSGVPVPGVVKSLTLNAEAGHTYRINANISSVETQFGKDVVGRTQMTTSFRWDPVFEDVTGKGLVDE
jgi:hypothetical protein